MSPILLFSIGSLEIYLHHAVLWLGIVLCMLLCIPALKKQGFSGPTRTVFLPLALLLGFLFAHLCYGLLRIEYALYDRSLLWLLMFWEGGYMLYGGMLGVALAALFSAKITKSSALKLMDSIAPVGALLIAFIRLAEGLSGSFFGDYLEDESVLSFFPFAVYDVYYEGWVEAVFMGGVIVALLVAVFLMLRKSAFDGDRTLLLVSLYAAGQIVLESMRFDDFLRWGFIRCSQVFSAMVILLVLLCYCRRCAGAWQKRRIALWIAFAVCAALVLVLEFAVDGKIDLLLFLTPVHCHTIMAVICTVMARCVLAMRKCSLTKEK